MAALAAPATFAEKRAKWRSNAVPRANKVGLRGHVQPARGVSVAHMKKSGKTRDARVLQWQGANLKAIQSGGLQRRQALHTGSSPAVDSAMFT